MWYLIRWHALWPVRQVVRGMAWLVAQVPGTTFGEIASMAPGPCDRCVGRAIQSPPESAG